MRSNALLLLHILVAMTLLGGVLAATVLSFASARDAGGVEPARRLAWWSALLVVVAAIATVGLGHGLEAKENFDELEPSWLQVSIGLTYFGLLLGGVALAVLTRLARSRSGAARAAGWLGTAMTAIALTVAFLMAAKPS